MKHSDTSTFIYCPSVDRKLTLSQRTVCCEISNARLVSVTLGGCYGWPVYLGAVGSHVGRFEKFSDNDLRKRGAGGGRVGSSRGEVEHESTPAVRLFRFNLFDSKPSELSTLPREFEVEAPRCLMTT